jgi:hypothetical protein
MNWLGKQLGFRRVEDWYQITQHHFRQWDGGGLLAQFADSPIAVLKDYRPDYKWLEWRFTHVPRRFWDDPANRHRYMDWLGEQLGFQRREDWYRISYAAITRRYGARLLAKFADSPIDVIRDYRPTYDWKEWLFPRPPQGSWAEPQNRRRYLNWLGQRLKFTCPEDWSRLRVVDVSTHRGQGLLKRFQFRIADIVKEYLETRV